MAPISNRDVSSTAGNDGDVGDAALQALIPFSGALSPEQVQRLMVGPNLNGPPAAIWRRTTIEHSNADGSFCLYACERTGEAMWVPGGEYFVADRPRGAQPAGTLMDYLFSQRRQAVRPEGYGIHHTDQMRSGENGNFRGPRNHHVSMVSRGERVGANRLHRFNPLARQEPAVAGTGNKRTVARRERRERQRGFNQTPLPPPPSTTSTSSTSTVVGGHSQGRTSATEGNEIPTTVTPPRRIAASITIYNSNSEISGRPDGAETPQMATLNLSDDEAL